MLWTPRGGLRPGTMSPPPTVQLPYGVAGTSPIGVHCRLSTAPTITRAGNRYFRNGSSFGALADNVHCTELDGDERRYISVYGAATSVLAYSSCDSHWSPTNVTDALSDDDSPISGIKWTDVTETSATGAHTYYSIATWYNCNDGNYSTALFLFRPGGRRYVICGLKDVGWGKLAFLRIDTQSMTILEEGDDAGGGTGFAFIDGTIKQLSEDEYLIRVIGENTTGGVISWAASIAGESTNDAYSGGFESYAGDDSEVAFSVVGGCVINDATAPYYGPPIVTAGAAATKNAEQVAMSIADFGIPGSFECLVRTWDTVPTSKRLWSWYDASADDAIELYLDADGHPHLRIHDGTSETVDLDSAVSVNDGVWHRVRAGWEHNNCGLWVDGTIVRDTSCTMPAVANLDASYLGASESGQYLDGELAECRWYKRRIM